jgi:SH3-like domain-containing protein
MRTNILQQGGVYIFRVAACVAGVAACNPGISLAGQIGFPCVGEINTDRINLRAGRSLNYEILARLDRDTRVTVCGRVSGWYRVMPLRDVPFWVSSRYISGGSVLTGRLNVRAKPSASSTVVCQLSRGERVEEIEKRGEWTSIRPPRGTYLWVSSELIDLLPDEKGSEKPEKLSSKEEDEEEKAVEVEEQPVASAPPMVEGAMIEGQPGAPATIRLEMARIPRAYEGRIVRSEESTISGADHSLVAGFLRTRVLCLLKSRAINLSYYEGDSVKVWGYEMGRSTSGIPVLDVRRIEVQ